jgi:hypothetical protein
MGVFFLAVFTDDLAVVVVVFDEELLWVFMEIDVELSNGVVDGWCLVSFLDSIL